MRVFRTPLLFSALALCTALALPATSSATSCVSGTVTVSQPNDPGFEGLYKYCITATWDVGQFGLSHIDFFLELETCECVCDPRIVQFPTPAGTSDGEGPEGDCTAEYNGEYLCTGDQTIPTSLNGPAVKYNAVGDCEPGVQGTGTWCFYSPFPPAPVSTHDVAIKHGQEVCYGSVLGSLPECHCETSTHVGTWGSIKATYR